MDPQNPIIFYDIPNRDRTGWSPNTWKVRYTLNYKGLAYKTVWTEFPDIEAVSLKNGVGPTTKKLDGGPSYTLPLIYDPSTKTAVAESIAIAKYLDETYPNTPQVFPKGTDALQAAFSLAAPVACGDPLFMLTIARIWETLNVESQAYFRTTREERFGAKLEDLYSEEQWELLEVGFGKVEKWLQGNGPGMGDFVMGDRITYADFQLAAILMWARTVFGEDSDGWKTIASWHGGKWKRWIEYFDKYATVDS